MAWIILVLAGLFEVGWAIGLKYTEGFTRLWPTVGTVVAMVISLGLLGIAMKSLPVGTAYAVWVGVGAVGTVILGIVLFDEPRQRAARGQRRADHRGLVGLKLATPCGGRRCISAGVMGVSSRSTASVRGTARRQRPARPRVDDLAEQLRGALGVVHRRVRFLAVPFQPGGLHRARQHGLAVGDAGQRHRVEHAEGMERVALVAAARDRGVEEVEVEVRVVADQDRALAAVLAASRRAPAANTWSSASRSGLASRNGWSRIDAGDFQRLRVDLGARAPASTWLLVISPTT